MNETDYQEPESRRAMRDLGRAAGGALVFSLPMLMTMELWWLGFYLDRLRLLALVITALPLLVVLSRYVGFEQTRHWLDDVVDALIALGVSGVVCVVALVLFGTITFDTPRDEVFGKVIIQMVPASIGALLAKSQFGAGSSESGEDDPADQHETYGGELFLMAVGALFLAFNVAPTEEMMLISYQMTEWHALCLVALSVALMHGFVFALGFAGGSDVSPREPWWSPVLRLTLPGYVIAASVSLYLLWVFARLDGLHIDSIVMATAVLAFPAAIGAAAARLIL
ncbi:MAG: TIGR02587 family membrane protein [Rhizobiaceae bacterium]|nr:TIGR02587 family membrane protein [Rhizobiaceae bacterium]MCV0407498.1 TIGR02587 family membrane protein [Rhizobiaceae bacterium]